MLKKLLLNVSLAGLLFACTQAPAPIEVKGDVFSILSPNQYAADDGWNNESPQEDVEPKYAPATYGRDGAYKDVKKAVSGQRHKGNYQQIPKGRGEMMAASKAVPAHDDFYDESPKRKIIEKEIAPPEFSDESPVRERALGDEAVKQSESLPQPAPLMPAKPKQRVYSNKEFNNIIEEPVKETAKQPNSSVEKAASSVADAKSQKMKEYPGFKPAETAKNQANDEVVVASGENVVSTAARPSELKINDETSENAGAVTASEQNKAAPPLEKAVIGEAKPAPKIEPIAGEKTTEKTVKESAVAQANVEEKKPEPKFQELAKPDKNAKNKAKFIWPLRGEVIEKYGTQPSGQVNEGISIRAAVGTPVKAVQGGSVVYAGSGLKGYGNLLIVDHGGETLTAYGHMQNIDVKEGDKIKQGQVVGRSGSTGTVNEPQLYFAVRKSGKTMNPVSWLP